MAAAEGTLTGVAGVDVDAEATAAAAAAALLPDDAVALLFAVAAGIVEDGKGNVRLDSRSRCSCFARPDKRGRGGRKGELAGAAQLPLSACRCFLLAFFG